MDDKSIEYRRCALLRALSPQRLCYIYYSYSMWMEENLFYAFSHCRVMHLHQVVQVGSDPVMI
jgi:hypothetical protein